MTEAITRATFSQSLLPANEPERLAALQRYKVLDTPPEKAFDRITSLAARLFDVPTVLIALIDESRVWIKSLYGFERQEIPREASICNFALSYDDVLVIPDTWQDERFACNEFVHREPGLRFYAGAPLLTPEGLILGTLCVLDTEPHPTFTDPQQATLTDLAAMVMDELELRLAACRIAQIEAALMEVTQGVSLTTGKAFFNALVHHLAKALGVRYACISLLVDQHPEKVKTIAFYAQGNIIDNVEYELQGTPCLEVIRQQKLGCYPCNLQALFPEDLFLVSLEIDSYASIPFFDSQGKLLGLLGVMDTQPLENIQLVESLLSFSALRIAAELERQQADEIKQEATQRLQLYANVVHNTQVGIVVWQLENLDDPGSFRMLIANAAASDATGLDLEALIGKTMAESFPTLLTTSLAQQYLQVVRSGRSLNLDEISYSGDGVSTGIYSTKAFPLPNQCLGLVFENITARKQIELQLKESQHFKQQIAEALPGVLYVHDLIQQRNIYINRQITDLLGYTPEQVQAMRENALPTLIHPDDLQQVIAYFDSFHTATDEAVLGLEYRAHHVNGTWRWVFTQSVVFNRTADGLPRQILGVSIDITDRKQAETALATQEQRYRYIFEAVNIAIVEEDFSAVKQAIDQLKATGIQDFRQYFAEHPELVQQMIQATKVKDVNQATLQMLGAKEKAELLSSLEQIFVPETQSAFIDELVAIAEEQTCFATETVLRNLQGDRLNVWFSITFPANSEPYNHVLVSLFDITQRKQSELELARSEAILNAFLAASPIPLTLFDQDLRFMYANEALAQLNGLPLNEHINRKLEDVVPAMAPQFAPLLRRIIETQEPVLDLEYRGEVQPGIYRHTIANHFPVSLPDGEVLGVGVTVTDITEMKRIEAELRQHSQRLNLLYETTRELLSAKRPLDLMNQLFVRLSAQLDLHYYYHFQLVEQDGKPHLRLTNHAGISAEEAQLFETLNFGQAMCGLAAQERRQIVLNQAEIAVHPNAQVICSMGVSAYAGQPLMVQGRLLGTLSYGSRTRTQFTPEEVHLMQAISEQVAIALDRAELVASLQQQTEDLAQANRVKDEFLAVLSHELRSPLNPILGWTKLLQTGKFDAQRTKQALEIIERNAKQQTQLIDDLLDISKILRGKLLLSEAPVDLALILEAALETMRLAAEAKSIQIITDLDSFLPPVLGDAGRLQQIVLNLLSNAIKFTSAGGQVDVSLKRVEAEAQIQVKDTGKGITPDFLPYVFESFRQEDGKTTRRFGGLGLGLAIVRQLTELHGGTVLAESVGEGMGATFTIRLPLMKTASFRVEDASQGTTACSPGNVLQGIRVLMVDDDADMRDLAITILEQVGAVVQLTASATEALRIFEQFQPALLISDIGMPEMDGYMLMHQIRALPPEQGGKTPAIALTAYASASDQQLAHQTGFQKHLSKPIEPEALIKAIVDLLSSTIPGGTTG